MPRKMMDLTGQRFGMLEVLELDSISNQGKNGSGKKTTWKCKCDCGNITYKITNNLRSGMTNSCGCLPTIGRTGDKNWKWKGGRTERPDGYIVIRAYDYPGSKKSLSIHEHVYVMAKHLGRPLEKHESVHHKNGIRNDNRLENLELWSRFQPAGQRVEDKVSYAIEILKLYAPEKLAFP